MSIFYLVKTSICLLLPPTCSGHHRRQPAPPVQPTQSHPIYLILPSHCFLTLGKFSMLIFSARFLYSYLVPAYGAGSDHSMQDPPQGLAWVPSKLVYLSGKPLPFFWFLAVACPSYQKLHQSGSSQTLYPRKRISRAQVRVVRDWYMVYI